MFLRALLPTAGCCLPACLSLRPASHQRCCQLAYQLLPRPWALPSPFCRAAPEMLWGQRCSEKADIYSYGILLWEICSGEQPLRGQLRDVRWVSWRIRRQRCAHWSGWPA